MDKTKTTHFGYEEVAVDEKVDKVGEVFRRVAPQYDLMNDVMSLGVHRLWKRFTVNLSQVRSGQKVLDLAGGTGDLTRAFAKRVGPTGQVILADINEAMLNEGRARLLDAGVFANVDFVLANAEALPFADNSFDCLTIGFGLRNVTNKDAALKEMCRVIKPGGQAIVLEFSKPTLPGLKPIYDAYSFNLLPKLGEWIAKDKASYQYLAESIRKHPDQRSLQTMMENAGLVQCRYHNLTGGIVAVHCGRKA